MRIGLDVTPLAGSLTGIGVFTAKLVAGLAADPDVEPVGLAFTARGRTEIERALPPDVPLGRVIPARFARAAWLRLDHPTARWLGGNAGPSLDVVHGTNFVVPPGGGAAELVSVHDLGPWITPELVTADARQFPALVDRAVRRGAHIHVLSEHVAVEVVERLGVAFDRVHPIHLGIDQPPDVASSLARPSVVTTLIGDDPFVLAIGTVEPRKNFPLLVAAMAELQAAQPDLHLVIAGGPSIGSEELDAAVRRHDLASRVHCLGYVDDDLKTALLRDADVVASSATHEGFGFVPLEAMAAGTPVVAAAGGAVPEVVGDAAVLVPVGDPVAMADGLERILAEPGTAEAMIQAGRSRIRHYSWGRTVTGLVDLYRQLAE